jgi:hypothetical protein
MGPISSYHGDVEGGGGDERVRARGAADQEMPCQEMPRMVHCPFPLDDRRRVVSGAIIYPMWDHKP